MGVIEDAFADIDPKAKQRIKKMINKVEYGYAINHLQREKESLDKALQETEKWHSYKESWKRQKNKSKQLSRAIKKLNE